MDNQNRNIYYNLELLQAISNWQAGSNEKKGNKLKELCVNLPEKFRLLPPNLVLFRQISLDNVGLSRFLREKSFLRRYLLGPQIINLLKNSKAVYLLNSGILKLPFLKPRH
ncbi:hypothetical protein OCUAc20_20630 [Acinetobacter baumannii]|nr:hypothetical protein [Acinetobacter baumannii]UMN38922.1 hypothetical protein L2Z12_01275 [Acinetobacter baumannii]WCE62483.1 hypothetical protein PL331_08910 [Acinetobacter baumannii]WCE64973.1 hypothetical protein PL332_08925 [Acinetobacter baumannii]BDE23563.1 hypothetical protein OCUAc20_20630 [Acinetobacter baumannii]